MVDALSPQRTKATGPRIRIHAIKAKLRHTGRMKSPTLNHSLNQDHVCPNRSAHPAISLPFSRARDALPRRLMNGRGIGGGSEEHYEYPLFLAARSSFRCEQPSSCWVLCAWMFAPEYFRYANSHSRMYRASDVFAEVQRYFQGNSVYGSKIAVVFNRRMHQRLRCQLRPST
jgi:hypothetical protein